MIVIEKSGKEFNLEEIYRGTLICARHKSWPEWQSGMVSDVSEKKFAFSIFLPSQMSRITFLYTLKTSKKKDGR